MTKRSKLAKLALKNPFLYTAGELLYFQKWLEERAKRKRLRKTEKAKRNKGYERHSKSIAKLNQDTPDYDSDYGETIRD